MPSLELFDETLDINSTENYRLLIQVSPDGFSFCLLDSLRNKLVLIRAFEPEDNKYFNADRINELINKDDFLTKRYKEVRIVMPSRKFTIVPAPLFDPGRKDEYFRFNHIIEDDNVIISNKINYPDIYIVSSVSKQISDIINGFYPGVHPVHHIKPLLTHILYNCKNLNGKYIHIHIERDYFNLIVFDKEDLKFCNTFNYRNITDILYFVFNVFKNLDIKNDETVYLSGLTERYDDFYSSFSIYIRNIKFAEPSVKYTFSYVFNDTELHRFLNLFNIINCE